MSRVVVSASLMVSLCAADGAMDACPTDTGLGLLQVGRGRAAAVHKALGGCSDMRDVELTCSDNGCKVLATNMRGKTCKQYCSENGRTCVGAWEENSDTCSVQRELHCDQTWGTTSDLLCECSAEEDEVEISDSCDGLTNVEQVCSSNGCKVLADGMRGRTCREYCGEHSLDCVGAWEERNEDCNVKAELTCDETYGSTSDLLCECAPRPVGVPSSPAPPSGKLVWADEFDGSSVNTSNWDIVHAGGGFGNQEKQFYRSDNARVEGGVLKIEARCESYGGERFTSAKLRTKGKADWGPGHRFDVRVRLPGGKGTWPAVWMLPTEKVYGGWPDSGEIDIMEAVGCTKDKVYGTVHTERYNHMRNSEKSGSKRTDVSEWHTYSIEWTSSKIKWFVDGHEYHRFVPSQKTSDRWPFDERFYLILNLAVGGSWGGMCVGGTPSCSRSDEFRYAQAMEVDFARVYTL